MAQQQYAAKHAHKAIFSHSPRGACLVLPYFTLFPPISTSRLFRLTFLISSKFSAKSSPAPGTAGILVKSVIGKSTTKAGPGHAGNLQQLKCKINFWPGVSLKTPVLPSANSRFPTARRPFSSAKTPHETSKHHKNAAGKAAFSYFAYRGLRILHTKRLPRLLFALPF